VRGGSFAGVGADCEDPIGGIDVDHSWPERSGFRVGHALLGDQDDGVADVDQVGGGSVDATLP
jgi:hypothetical protein